MIDRCGKHGPAVLLVPVGEVGAATDEADPERRDGVDRRAVGLHTDQSRGDADWPATGSVRANRARQAT